MMSNGEYFALLSRARRIGSNYDLLSREERRRQQEAFRSYLDEKYDPSDEAVTRLKIAVTTGDEFGY